MADKQGDPHEKPGMVGAFCRTYSIPEAIETFLEDRYEPSTKWALYLYRRFNDRRINPIRK
jgi:hypothetical protein